MKRSRVLTAEDREELQRRYEANEPRAEIVAWLKEGGYSHTWKTIVNMEFDGTKRQNRWPDEAIAYLQKHGGTLTDATLARHLNERWGMSTTADSVKARRRTRLNIYKLPAPLLPLGDRPLRVRESALIMGCIHAGAHDPKWLELIVGTAQAAGIKVAVLLGDFLNLDTWTRWQHYVELTPSKEREHAQDLLRWLAGSFEKLYYTQGNHEERVWKETGSRIPAAEFIRGLIDEVRLDNVQISDLRWCEVLGWHCEHAKRAGGQFAAHVAANIASQRHRNVIIAHPHRWGETQDVSGKFVGACIGHCADPKRLGYAHRVTFSTSQPTQGAALLMDTPSGVKMHLLHPEKTDFEALKRGYAA